MCWSVEDSSQIARFMGPTWGPPGSCRPQLGPMLAPWTLLSGLSHTVCKYSLEEQHCIPLKQSRWYSVSVPPTHPSHCLLVLRMFTDNVFPCCRGEACFWLVARTPMYYCWWSHDSWNRDQLYVTLLLALLCSQGYQSNYNGYRNVDNSPSDKTSTGSVQSYCVTSETAWISNGHQILRNSLGLDPWLMKK